MNDEPIIWQEVNGGMLGTQVVHVPPETLYDVKLTAEEIAELHESLSVQWFKEVAHEERAE
jgi:hypothetical protein